MFYHVHVSIFYGIHQIFNRRVPHIGKKLAEKYPKQPKINIWNLHIVYCVHTVCLSIPNLAEKFGLFSFIGIYCKAVWNVWIPSWKTTVVSKAEFLSALNGSSNLRQIKIYFTIVLKNGSWKLFLDIPPSLHMPTWLEILQTSIY